MNRFYPVEIRDKEVFPTQISCRALATDYDGTIAHDGIVSDATLASLRKFHASGRKLILVTGRQYEELKGVFPEAEEFDVVVAENGAHLHWPADHREELLGHPPPAEFMALLAKEDVRPVLVGRVIVATFEPHEVAVLNAIKTLGLEMQVIFNKGAVMALPSGINKAAGLKHALKALEIRPVDVVAVGDAENDHALFEYSGFTAAVANALPSLKEQAKWVLRGAHGEGVSELIDLILASNAV